MIVCLFSSANIRRFAYCSQTFSQKLSVFNFCKDFKLLLQNLYGHNHIALFAVSRIVEQVGHFCLYRASRVFFPIMLLQQQDVSLGKD